MSGYSDMCNCPNCGALASRSEETVSYSSISIQCLHCGLMISPSVEYMDLEALNEARQEDNLPPLQVLPEQSTEF
jgi:hypothetical protein